MPSEAPFIRSVEVPEAAAIDTGAFPWTLPAAAALLDGLELDPRVTFLVGENGSGKSTLIEAFAVAAGLNPEGGSSQFSYSTRDSHSGLSSALRLVRSQRRPRTDFFLRAESFFTAATYLEELKKEAAEAASPQALSSSSPPTRRSCSPTPTRRSTSAARTD